MDAHLGPYRVIQWLGRGGMAEVQLALRLGSEGFERRVVVKCLHDHLCGNPEAERRFTEEALLGSQLDHSLIVKVLDLGRSQGRPYMAMEYVNGLDLRSVLAAGPMPLEVALYTAREVARALHYAHTLHDVWGQPLGIVHRDVTPSNILLSGAGEVKLTDFGVAKALGREATRSGIIKGKYAYMSPEQVDSGEVGPRSDLFSLGAVLYEALTGVRLFAGTSPLEILKRVREVTRLPLPEELQAQCPELGSILDRALARDWRSRYQTARAMSLDLSLALIGLGQVAPDEQVAQHIQRVAQATPPSGQPPVETHEVTLSRVAGDDVATRDWVVVDEDEAWLAADEQGEGWPPDSGSIGETTNNVF